MPNYNPYYSQVYPQNYAQNYPQNYNQPTQQTQPQPPQIQNGALVPIPSEMDARNFPVTLGTSVSFKDESLPNVYYSKTMPASQFERPIFKRYRMIEEDISEQTQSAQNESKTTDADNSTIKELKSKIDMLEDEIEGIKKKMVTKTSTKKKEVEDDSE